MGTFDKISNILKDLSGAGTVFPESSLQNDLGLDSLGMVMLLIELENSFGIELDESDMNPFDLVDVLSVVELVDKYIGDHNEENA